MYRGEYQEAVNRLKQSVSLYSSIDPAHPKLVWALIYLGDMFGDLSDFEEARDHYKQALDINVKRFDEHHIKSIRAMFRLGTALKKLGDYNTALKYLEKCCATYKSHYPEEKNISAWTSVHLGHLYLQLGLIDNARAAVTYGLDLHTEFSGRDSIHAEWDAMHLGQVKVFDKQYDEAQQLMEKSTRAHQQQFKKDHKRVGWCKHNLACLHKASQNFELSEQLFSECLPIYCTKLGEQSVETAEVLTDYAHLKFLKKDYISAQSMLKRAMDIYLKFKNNPLIYRCHEILGQLFQQQGNHAKAKEHLMQALSIAKNKFPSHSAHVHRLNDLLMLVA